jgi:hypothetical protein
VATGSGARRIVRDRSPLAFYVAATLAMWAFSFGPSPSIGDLEIRSWAPYRWLTLLPGYDGLRVPARFAMLAALCLAAAAGIALAARGDSVPRPNHAGHDRGSRRVARWRSVSVGRRVLHREGGRHPRAMMELPLGDPWRT